MPKLNVAVVVGSNRRESINRKLAEAIAKLGAGTLSFTFVKIDDLPLYNQDLETPLPESVARMKREIEAADGVLFVTPEHSRSLPAVLKNAIDWGARPWGKNSWTGKPAAVTGTSPGAIGTAIVQQHLRSVAGILGMLVLGGEHYVTFKPELIGPDGAIADASTRAFLQGLVDQFAALVERFADGAAGARQSAA
jgi:chromate reductase